MWTEVWMREAFWQGLWGGVFDLIAIGGVASWINIVYQKIRSRQNARKDLIDELDDFSNGLYKPRKLYQALLDRPELLSEIKDESERATQKALLMHQSLSELTEASGRFRALQVKLVPLFGYDVELFAYYLSIWRYLREIRKRMERRETLYFHHETAASSDAFYELIDRFRYQILIKRSVKDKPNLIQPPEDLLQEMKQRSDELFLKYFQPRTTSDSTSDPSTSDSSSSSDSNIS